MEQFPGAHQAQIPSAPYHDEAHIPTGPLCHPSAMQPPPPFQHVQQHYSPQININYQPPPVRETVQQTFHHQAAAPYHFPAQGIPVQGITALQLTAGPVAAQGWSSGLLDCCNDPLNAIITILLPCLTFGEVAEIVDNGQTSCATSGILYCCIAYFIGCPCILSCTYRSKLRAKFRIIESPAPDCITHFLCELCALCQEYRELQARGFDPSIGWQGNIAKIQMQQQTSTTPPADQRMGMI